MPMIDLAMSQQDPTSLPREPPNAARPLSQSHLNKQDLNSTVQYL